MPHWWNLSCSEKSHHSCLPLELVWTEVDSLPHPYPLLSWSFSNCLAFPPFPVTALSQTDGVYRQERDGSSLAAKLELATRNRPSEDANQKRVLKVAATTTAQSRDFPGGPAAETPRSQCKGPGFDPWSQNQIPHATAKDSVCDNQDPARSKKERNSFQNLNCSEQRPMSLA